MDMPKIPRADFDVEPMGIWRIRAEGLTGRRILPK